MSAAYAGSEEQQGIYQPVMQLLSTATLHNGNKIFSTTWSFLAQK
jgi:hypothetical protein